MYRLMGQQRYTNLYMSRKELMDIVVIIAGRCYARLRRLPELLPPIQHSSHPLTQTYSHFYFPSHSISPSPRIAQCTNQARAK